MSEISNAIEVLSKELLVPRHTELESGRLLDDFGVSRTCPTEARDMKFSHTDYLKCYYLDCMIYKLELEFDTGATIISGKRSDYINEMVGGSKNSAHLFTDERAAVDFTMKKIKDVYEYARINFFYGELFFYPLNGFIHMTLPFKDNLMQNGVM